MAKTQPTNVRVLSLGHPLLRTVLNTMLELDQSFLQFVVGCGRSTYIAARRLSTSRQTELCRTRKSAPRFHVARFDLLSSSGGLVIAGRLSSAVGDDYFFVGSTKLHTQQLGVVA